MIQEERIWNVILTKKSSNECFRMLWVTCLCFICSIIAGAIAFVLESSYLVQDIQLHTCDWSWAYVLAMSFCIRGRAKMPIKWIGHNTVYPILRTDADKWGGLELFEYHAVIYKVQYMEIWACNFLFTNFFASLMEL